MTDIKAKKSQLREQAIKHRARINLGDENIGTVADLFFKHIQPQPGQIIAGYYPKGREFDALRILEQWTEQGGQACLPVVEKDSRILKFYDWNTNSEMQMGSYNIPEPVEQKNPVTPDVVIVPMLAFDRSGARLGYGGGYYDTTLKSLRGQKDIIAVGVAYASQAVLFSLPKESHDQKLDWIITPNGATQIA